ncbi:MAG: hypothetical protein LZF86_110083 [Nitrospira sp.]|nr:MAG: hypothetical protein LZF86_110083 [Nitrospira sp.]
MFQEALHDIVERLAKARTQGLLEQFALIGGLAVSVWAEPRATRDIDFAVALQAGSPQSLAEVLRGTYRAGDLGDPLLGVITASSGMRERTIPVQLIFLPRRLSAVVFERMQEVTVLGCVVPVVAWESLVLLKLYAGGPRDVLDAKQICAAQAPDAGALTAVATLANRAGLSEEWEQFRFRIVTP